MSVSSTSTDPVDAIYDLLNGYTGWTNATPEVRYQWKWSPDQRENSRDPAIYVWSPTEGSYDAFDAEYSHLDEGQTIEANIWTLDDSETSTYSEDVVDFLSEYGNDNESQTEFHRIRPQNNNDMRQENIARKTDHFIASVQINLRNFRNTGT